MYSSLASLALLVNAVAALPQGWESWGYLNSISISKTTTTSTTTYTTGNTARETSQSFTSLSSSKTPVASTTTTTTTRTVEDPGWGNWQSSTLSTSSATSKSIRSQSTDKSGRLSSSTYSSSSYPTVLTSGWRNWNTTLPDRPSYTSSDFPKRPTFSSNPAPNAPEYSKVYSGQPSSTLTSQPWSDWSESSSTGALYTATAPTATFVPVRSWDHDGQAPDHLQPDGQKQIYFASEGQGSTDSFHQFAALALNFTSHTVLLDHSDFLFHDYEEGSSSMMITFTTIDAFVIAQSFWEEGLIFGVTDGDCGKSGAGCFLRTTAMSFDETSLSCMATVTSLEFNDACHGFQIDWGHYTPIWTSGKTWSQTTGMTSTASTSSPTTTNGATCTPPRDDVFNLPTACLGQYFDNDLDQTYGLERIEDSSFSNFLTEYPNLVLEDPTPLDDEDAQDGDTGEVVFGASEKRHLKRQATAPASYRRPIQLFATSFDIPQSQNLVDSPWGEQLLIKQFTAGNAPAGQGLPGNLAFYCVDCRLSGSVDVTGSAHVSLFHGITDLGVRADANMALNLNVGVDAQIQYQGGYKGTLFNVPLSPFTILSLVSVGPYMELGVDLGFEANAQGQLLAGASLSWPNAFADISVRPSFGTSSGGFQPVFKPTLQANGSIDLSARFGLPIEIGVGFTALGFELKAGIVDLPSIFGNATAAALIDNGVKAIDGCNGIKTSINLSNELYAQVTGFNKVDILKPVNWNIGPDCIGYTGQGGGNNGIVSTLTPNNSTNTNGNGTITDSGSSTNKPCGSYPTLPCQANSTASNDTVRDSTAEIPIVASNITYTEKPNTDGSPDSTDSYSDTTSYFEATLIDASAAYQVYPCRDGNVYLFGINDAIHTSQCADKWTMTQDEEVVVTDGLTRVPIYFPDEMSKTGVSRLRLVDVEEIPNGANELIFKTSTDQLTSDEVYHAENPAGDEFYPVVCYYSDNSLPKVFMVQDLELGSVTLTLSTVKYSITGGDVSSCSELKLIQGDGYFPPGVSDGLDDSAGVGEWESVFKDRKLL